MAAKTASKVVPEAKSQFVTKKEFDELNSSVNRLVDMLEATMKEKTTPEATKLEKAVTAAGPNVYSTDEEWDAIAREIIGDEVIDHTEVERKGGGLKFTIVIKNEHSNASQEYLERTKSDRRTREVGAEGTEGVMQYCRLVKANLARGKKL